MLNREGGSAAKYCSDFPIARHPCRHPPAMEMKLESARGSVAVIGRLPIPERKNALE